MLEQSSPYSTMVELLRYRGVHDAHKPAFIFFDKHRNRYELTQGQLYQLGGRWAAVLQKEGVGQGERVVSTLPNGPERALCDVGIVMAGAVVVNAQCQLADGSDMLFTLRQSKARAVCIDPDYECGPWHVLKQHVEYDPVTHVVTSNSLPDLGNIFFIRRTSPLSHDAVTASKFSTECSKPVSKNVVKDGFSTPETMDFVESLKNVSEFYEAEVEAQDIVTVFNTSGSTGFSKLVPMTHAVLTAACKMMFSLSDDALSKMFSIAPLGWVGGTVFIMLLNDKSRLLLDMWYGPPEDLAAFVWDIIVQERCDDAVMVPFHLSKIVALKDRKGWMMKHLVLEGQPVKTEMVHQALQLADRAHVDYGSTELGYISFVTVTDTSQYQDFLVGKPTPSCSLKICDSEGKEVPRGTKGEIYAKTTAMFTAYLNNPVDTAASITADGFLKTGDIGVMLEDGSLLVEGRQHDAIHRGNYIFYPAWLESRIMECCPGLQNVFVVGVPDPAMGEEICACFVAFDPSVTEERVRSLVEKDILTKVEDFMSPRPRYYLRFQAFPKTYTDKPERKDVRRQAIAKLNLAWVNVLLKQTY